MSRRKSRSGPPKRRVSNSAARKSIYAVVEGALTEPDYLNHWFQANRAAVTLEIHSKKGLSPRQMIDVAVDQKRTSDREAKRGHGAAYDEVWCVFDVDEHPALDEVKTKAHDNGVLLAISNPCIELWFLLHFRDQTGELSRHEAQRLCAGSIGSGKALSSTTCELLAAGHESAVRRALALTAQHRRNGLDAHANPSSNIWELVESIRAPRGQVI